MVPTRFLIAALAAAAVLPTAIYYIYYAGPYQTWIYVEEGSTPTWLNYTGLVREYAPGPKCDVVVRGECYSLVREFYTTRGLWLEPGRLYYVDERLYVREVRNETAPRVTLVVRLIYNMLYGKYTLNETYDFYLVFDRGVLYRPPPTCPTISYGDIYSISGDIAERIRAYQSRLVLVSYSTYRVTLDAFETHIQFQVVGYYDNGKLVFQIPNEYGYKIDRVYLVCG